MQQKIKVEPKCRRDESRTRPGSLELKSLLRRASSVCWAVLTLCACPGASRADEHSAWEPPALSALCGEEVLSIPLPHRAADFRFNSLSFEPNVGQMDPSVAFLTRGKGYTLFLTPNEAVLVLNPGRPRQAFDAGKPDCARKTSEALQTEPEPAREPARVLRMRLVGANPAPVLVAEQALRGKVNYFKGNDPTRWRTNIPTAGRVRYREVYPGIDLVYYGNGGQLEYDFIVAPGANPAQIAMEFEGADELRVEEGGELLLQVGEREVRWQKPFIFQEVNGKRQEIAGAYRLAPDFGRSAVAFTVASYEGRLPLTIDPRLVYSTYLGGSGHDLGDQEVGHDATGNLYVSGNTWSADFPLKNALDATYGGDLGDLFVAKFSPSGELLFSTYLGGSHGEDWGRGRCLAVSPEGDCYIGGGTSSLDYPVKDAVQKYGGNWDAVITGIKSDGSALLFSTYLGGENSDSVATITLIPGGDLLLVGNTTSAYFPTTNAFQPKISEPFGGQQLREGFITRLSADGRSLVYSTYYGRSTDDDQPSDGVVDADGNAYVGLWSTTHDNRQQWVITKLSPDGKTRLFERRWPAVASGNIQIYWGPRLGLAPDERLIAAGSLNIMNLPAMNEPNPTTAEGYSEIYLAAFNATNGAYIIGRYFGGSGHEFVGGIDVDSAGNITVAGDTVGPSWATSDIPVTDPLPDGPVAGTSFDVAIMRFDSSDLAMTFSTLIGQAGEEFARGLAPAPGGNISVVGYIDGDGEFPLVKPFQSQRGGGTETFLFQLSFGERIQISRVGQTLRIAWPLSASGFVLESADSPASGTWSVVAKPPVADGEENVVTVEIGLGAQYFRLREL